MIQLRAIHCEFTYEGAFAKPAFYLADYPGRLCDLLLNTLRDYGCTRDDLVAEEGDPGERGIACEVDELDARVTLRGDRIEIYSANFLTDVAEKIPTILKELWSGMAALDAVAVAQTHSLQFETDMEIRGASYQELMNRLARAPGSLPRGTETAVVYYLPGEPGKGFGESSLVLNRSDEVEGGLQVSATMVFDAESGKRLASISEARIRIGEILRDLGLECIED